MKTVMKIAAAVLIAAAPMAQVQAMPELSKSDREWNQLVSGWYAVSARQRGGKADVYHDCVKRASLCFTMLGAIDESNGSRVIITVVKGTNETIKMRKFCSINQVVARCVNWDTHEVTEIPLHH